MCCKNTPIFQSCEVLRNSFFNYKLNFQNYIQCVPPVLRSWSAEQLRFCEQEMFPDCCDTKADDKRLKFYDQLELFVEVGLLVGCDKIYCIFAKIQSFPACQYVLTNFLW